MTAALAVRTVPPVPEAVAAPADNVFARIAAGEARAVDECVAAFGGLVWSLARRWSGDGDEAEDAAQEIFYDLWRSAPRFDASRCSERGFVAMIARRRLIDRARKRRRSLELVEMPEDFDPADDRGESTDRLALAGDAHDLLAALTPLQRRMLELNLLEGKTHDEIARETNTPLGTVKSHIRRGLDRARRLLAARAGNGDAA